MVTFSHELGGSSLGTAGSRLLGYLPRGNLLDDTAWRRRHTLLRWLLALHAPGLLLFGLLEGRPGSTSLAVVTPVGVCLLLSHLVTRRRLASFFVTAGLVYCSSALVGLSGGSIEAHFHFFIIVGFIALYQDWVPFLWNIAFTVLSHGLGSAWSNTLIFNHPAGQRNPWLWSLIHGVAVLAACVGMVIFWRYSEDEQQRHIALRTHLAEAEVERRRFTSDLLVNLARRNQNLFQRQLAILSQLQETERDPKVLAELFRLDHLVTRVRRNAESLLVLSGEEPPRVWRQSIPLVDVVRAAVAETEELDRVVQEVDEGLAVHGHQVTPLTHLLAELVENAARFSPPGTHVTVRTWPDARGEGAYLLTVEDSGLGMPAEDVEAANALLAEPPDVDLSTSRRFGLHVVARLARRHGIGVRLTSSASNGVTAVVTLPASIFVPRRQDDPPVGRDRPGADAGSLARAREIADARRQVQGGGPGRSTSGNGTLAAPSAAIRHAPEGGSADSA
ncbi:MAG TPA: ATP-binding protein [Kineosporiaceae bacterium]